MKGNSYFGLVEEPICWLWMMEVIMNGDSQSSKPVLWMGIPTVGEGHIAMEFLQGVHNMLNLM